MDIPDSPYNIDDTVQYFLLCAIVAITASTYVIIKNGRNQSVYKHGGR